MIAPIYGVIAEMSFFFINRTRLIFLKLVQCNVCINVVHQLGIFILFLNDFSMTL